MTMMSMSRARAVMLGAVAVISLGLLGAVAPSMARAANAPNGYPYCSSSSSDPDGDGWGWENSQSCVVKGGKADSGSSSGSGGYPTCSSSSSDPDGDGWGWENNQSCKVASGSSGGGSGSLSCPNGMQCGSYSISGLGSRKQQILGAGGNSLDVAIAMLETDNMNTAYAYGDNKSYDSANFGIFKQNWGMLRVACSRFKGQSQSQWNNGAVLNSNLSADISCRHQSESYYGTTRWFAGHRNGSSGLSNPYTSDIKGYMAAVYWIQKQLNNGNMSNNTRYWVYVVPI